MSRAETFETLHRSQPDPWGVDSSWYERRKRDVTLAALPREGYQRGFEPGCSIGALSADLARRCETLLVADISPSAVQRARIRLAPCPNVKVAQLEIPDEWPDQEFDLIVVSEIAYFLHPDELDLLIARSLTSLGNGGDLMLVNWRGPITGFAGLDAAAVHSRFREALGLRSTVFHEEPDFLMEVFSG